MGKSVADTAVDGVAAPYRHLLEEEDDIFTFPEITGQRKPKSRKSAVPRMTKVKAKSIKKKETPQIRYQTRSVTRQKKYAEEVWGKDGKDPEAQDSDTCKENRE